MRIETVTAHGFGPLTRRTLDLAPGFTVVVGDNESGKSSWHAATVAALCGRRRGRGRLSGLEQQFMDAHQPWDGGPWSVSTEIELDDGRRIELRQDLSGKVDCRATDVGLARDVSAEIMVDGSPDASAWLGLTRDTFRATACVSQAQVLDVLDAADGLQHSLQQAAATAGTSGTAAVAIDLLETCRRTAVGRDTAAATRPLRRARDAVAVAEQRLAALQLARQDFAELAEEGARLATEAKAAEQHADAAAAEARALGEALKVAEASVADPEPMRDVGPRIRTRPRRQALIGALIAAALALVAGAVVTHSAVLVSLAVVIAVVAAGCAFVADRGAPVASSGLSRQAASAPRSPPGSAEMRMEWAERQALAEGARRRHHEIALRATRADAIRVERGQGLPAVAEAEECLAAARRELTRVQELDETLSLAIGFLARAQDRVHRAVAPELSCLLRAWLPRLTAGRYVDARLDPATLMVQVCGPSRQFRRAELLSHGTAEQVHLLLRVALATRLTAGHDTCPLLLDDITVHADPQRTQRLLELLHELSAERQIVLFAQQPAVREWAGDHLVQPRDRLVVLDGPQPP